MPIKYQALGGGGSGLTVAINTGVGSSVTLSKEKYNKTLIANNNGLAVFENLIIGTYNVKVVADGGLTDQMAIQVTGNQTEQVVFKVKELQLGSKIKFSSGKKFLLSGKDVEGHATNSATLWSEYIIENYEFRRDGTSGTEIDNRNGCAYIDSTVHKKLMPKYYNELNDAEKSVLLEYRAKTYDNENGGFDYTNSFFWLPSDSELSAEGSYTKDKEGKNIYLKMYEHLYDFVNATIGGGVTYNWTRPKTLEGEKIPKPYFTRTNDFLDTFWRAGCVYGGDRGGTTGQGYISVTNLPSTAGIAPACDISQDAFVTLDSDGYYFIIGK